MKNLGIGILVLLIMLVVLTVALFLYVDTIAKSAIERGSTYALGVETTLDKADVGILSGEFSMSGLEVSNPEGFDREHFLRLGEGFVSVSLGSLREDLIELPVLTLDDIHLVLEKKGGKSNYKVIADNLKKFESPDTSGEAAGEKAGKQFVIREVVITNINVEADVTGIGGKLNTVKVPIKEIRLENVGSGGDGVDMGQLTNIIIKAVLAAVLANAAEFPADLVSDLGPALDQLTSLGELGITEAYSGVEDLAKSLENLGSAETVEDFARGVEDVGKAIEGLEGLFGGKKKDP